MGAARRAPAARQCTFTFLVIARHGGGGSTVAAVAVASAAAAATTTTADRSRTVRRSRRAAETTASRARGVGDVVRLSMYGCVYFLAAAFAPINNRYYYFFFFLLALVCLFFVFLTVEHRAARQIGRRIFDIFLSRFRNDRYCLLVHPPRRLVQLTTIIISYALGLFVLQVPPRTHGSPSDAPSSVCPQSPVSDHPHPTRTQWRTDDSRQCHTVDDWTCAAGPSPYPRESTERARSAGRARRVPVV